MNCKLKLIDSDYHVVSIDNFVEVGDPYLSQDGRILYWLQELDTAFLDQELGKPNKLLASTKKSDNVKLLDINLVNQLVDSERHKLKEYLDKTLPLNRTMGCNNDYYRMFVNKGFNFHLEISQDRVYTSQDIIDIYESFKAKVRKSNSLGHFLENESMILAESMDEVFKKYIEWDVSYIDDELKLI